MNISFKTLMKLEVLLLLDEYGRQIESEYGPGNLSKGLPGKILLASTVPSI